MTPSAHRPDPSEVEDVIMSYCEAMDVNDIEQAVSVFTPDAVIDTLEGSRLVGSAAIRAYLENHSREFSASFHHVSNARTNWADDGTSLVSTNWLVWRQKENGAQERYYVRCDDDLTSDGDTWRIQQRRFTVRGTERIVSDAEQVLHVMATSRSVRRFREQPVADELIRQVIEAATWAPSPQNRQPWEFLALTTRESVGVAAEAISTRGPELRSLGERASHPERRKMFLDVAALVEGLDNVPALILVCGHPLQHDSPAGRDAMLLSALYGASQNLLLAARALGLGAVFTTLHVHGEEMIRQELDIPDDVTIAGTIAIGWPETSPKKVRRRPVEDVLHWQKW